MSPWRSLVISMSIFLSWQGLSAEYQSSSAQAQAIRQRPITDEIFYFIVIDRFNDGDAANNKAYDKVAVNSPDDKNDIKRHGFQPQLENFYHGGDFAGIRQKLDYLQGLGVSSIWLSPIMKNRATQVSDGPLGVSSGYHGYWILDFTKVDPHWGTEEDFKTLVIEAHNRGIKIFMDVITNHTADLISYRECSDCPYRSRAEYPYSGIKHGKQLNQEFTDGDFSPENFAKLKDTNYAYTPYIQNPKIKKVPDWLNDISLYHNRGNSSFAGENSELGDFYGLDDLFTENPRVVQGMIDIYADWIRKYRIDGFRIDTVKHVNIEFWEQFIPAIRKVAQDAGIPNFYMFGEVFSTDPSLLSRYTRLGKFDSVLDFGLQSAIKDVFVGEQSGERLHEYLAQDDLHRLASSPQKMMNFVSNHDIGRLAFELKNHFKGANEDELIKRLQLAYAFIYFARGIPVLYYGDEQGFIGTGGDSGAREDMFASKTPRYSAIKHLGAALTPDQPSFDSMHTLYQKLAQFAEIRRQNPGLESGEYSPIRDFGPSILAFRRSLFDSHDEYIVLINLLNTTQDIAWSRIGFSRIYPTGSLDTSLSLPPLSMQILKGPRTKDKPRLAPEAKFTQLDEHQRIAGLFFEELKLGEDARYRVKFSVRTGKEKEFKELYTDLSPPYRAYIDGSKYPNGTELHLKAEIESLSGQKAIALRHLIIDSRPALVTVVYENGNAQSEAYHVSGQGSITQPQFLKENSYSFSWPLKETDETLIFTSKIEGRRIYDQPIFLKFKRDIHPHLKTLADGQASLTIFINNLGELSYDGLRRNPEQKPAILPGGSPSEKKFTPKDLYVRGTMNSWNAGNELKFQGNSSYRSLIPLSSGLIEFKIADADWSAGTNFGSPATEEGLNGNGGSGNLSFELGKGDEGTYSFEFIHLPEGENFGGRTRSLICIERIK